MSPFRSGSTSVTSPPVRASVEEGPPLDPSPALVLTHSGGVTPFFRWFLLVGSTDPSSLFLHCDPGPELLPVSVVLLLYPLPQGPSPCFSADSRPCLRTSSGATQVPSSSDWHRCRVPHTPLTGDEIRTLELFVPSRAPCHGWRGAGRRGVRFAEGGTGVGTATDGDGRAGTDGDIATEEGSPVGRLRSRSATGDPMR